MLKRLVSLTLSLGLVFGLLTVVSAVIGRGFDTPVVLATVYPEGSSGISDHTGQIALFDLSRFLRADHPIPLVDVQQITFNDVHPEQVLVSTYSANYQERQFQGGFHQYNFLTSQLTTVQSIDSDKPMYSSYSLYSSFFPQMSHDGGGITFVHPVEQKPYVYDTVSNELSLLADLQIDQNRGLNGLSWSPDSTKLALKNGSILYVFDEKGSQQLEYAAATEDFYSVWSEDSQYLLIQRFDLDSTTTNSPIQVIDTEDGSEHPFTKGLEGNPGSWYGCDGRWLTYTTRVNEQTREGYLLNMQNGEKIRVNDAPLLEDIPIIALSPVGNCEYFLVYTLTSPVISSGRRTPSLYLFDMAEKTAEFVDEVTAVLRTTDKALYFERVDKTSNHRQIYRYPLNINAEPELIGEYEPMGSAWLNWSNDMTFATFAGINTSNNLQQLYLLDGQTGQRYRLTSENEVLENYMQVNWSQIRNPETS
jgi:hypothetical protein